MYINELITKIGNAHVFGFLEPKNIQRSGNKKKDGMSVLHSKMDGEIQKRNLHGPHIAA